MKEKRLCEVRAAAQANEDLILEGMPIVYDTPTVVMTRQGHTRR